MLSLRSTSSHPSDACSLSLDIPVWISNSSGPLPALGDRVFTDSGGTTPFIGNGQYYHLVFQVDPGNGISAVIDNDGYINGIVSICP
jgi:hypothetical protein